MAINPDATIIPDQAEVWLLLKSDLVGAYSGMIPANTATDLEALGWEFCGLIDDAKGIPLDPSVEVKLETNAVTEKIVLPGSAAGMIGIPKDVQVYVLYKFEDDDAIRIWVSLTPAPVELKSHGGIIDGELSFAELVIHHTSNADNDVFEIVDAGGEA